MLAQFRILSALHRLPVFRDVNSYQLLRLVNRAVTRTFRRGEPVVLPDEDGGDQPYLLQVLDGEVAVSFDDSLGRDGQLMIREGEIFGELSYIIHRPIGARLTALRLVTVLFYLKSDFDRLFSCSASFRRAVKRGLETVSGQADLASTYDVPDLFPEAPAELVMFDAGDDGADWPLSALGNLLARTLADDYATRVLILEIAGSDGEASGRVRGAGGVDRVRIRLPKVLQRLRKLAPQYEYIFIQPDAGVRTDWRNDPEVVARLSRIRMWSAPPPASVANDLRGPQVVESVLLDPATSRRSPPRLRRVKDVTEGRGLAMGIPRLECRLALDLDAVSRAFADGGPDGLDGVYGRSRETLSRWGRTVTGRNVGLALGGGGAWGYAHIPLIRALHARGVPIDVVTGASFGSVVGAYMAHMFGVRAGATIAGGPKPYIGGGFDLLSGDKDPTDDVVRTFDTLYATNHKFYGHMDAYLALPKHTRGEGLIDGQLNTKFKLCEKSSLGFDTHVFASAAPADSEAAFHGLEFDLNAKYKPWKPLTLSAGVWVYVPGAFWGDDPSPEVGAYLATDFQLK